MKNVIPGWGGVDNGNDTYTSTGIIKKISDRGGDDHGGDMMIGNSLEDNTRNNTHEGCVCSTP